jgi:hypothetical protein
LNRFKVFIFQGFSEISGSRVQVQLAIFFIFIFRETLQIVDSIKIYLF